MTPKHSAEGLSSVFQCKKAVVCLTEKILVLVSFIQARANSPTACEFNVNELTIYVKENVLKQKHTQTRLCIDRLMKI